jgi:hypothetical protein
VKKRIEVMDLPIKFTPLALLAINCFCDRPGAAVLLLVDALNYFKDKTVTVQTLRELYPVGFYTEAAMIDRVDNELKTKKDFYGYVYE